MRGERVCLVLTYRSDDLHRRHPLLAVLAEVMRSPRVETMTLGRLGLDDTVALVHSISDGDGDATAVYERSDGNPFLVEELVAAGSEDPDARIRRPSARH